MDTFQPDSVGCSSGSLKMDNVLLAKPQDSFLFAYRSGQGNYGFECVGSQEKHGPQEESRRHQACVQHSTMNQ